MARYSTFTRGWLAHGEAPTSTTSPSAWRSFECAHVFDHSMRKRLRRVENLAVASQSCTPATSNTIAAE